MGTKVEAPVPTPEENALRAEQTNLLRSQRDILLTQQKQQTALLPIFAKQLGLNLQFDKQGNVIGATQTKEQAKLDTLQQQLMEKSLDQLLHPEKDPLRQRQQNLLDLQLKQLEEELTGPQAKQSAEIERLLGEKTLKALRGELDVDPALERGIREQRGTLRDRLRQQLGTGFETSSPGIEALGKFEESAEVLRSQARRGELTLSEQLSSARQGADVALGGQRLAASQVRIPGVDPLGTGGFAFGVGQGGTQNQAVLRQVLASPLGIAGGLGQVAGGFQMPIGQLMNQRQMEFDASIQNAQSSMAGLGALGSVFGSIFALSDESLKKDKRLVGLTKDGIPIYTFRWKEGPEGLQVGVMAQDVERLRPDAMRRLFGHKAVDYGAL